jgi:serine protease Do
MNASTKRVLSTIAIVIASVAFGILVSADLGLMKPSSAQTSAAAPIQTAVGSVPAVTIPSFADVAARVMPAVVSITSTEVVRRSDMQRRGTGIDPFDFFFPNPQDPRRQPQPRGQGQGQGEDDDDDARRQQSGGSGFIISPDGYILTNNHVVEGASKVDVHYGADENGNGGHIVPATIIGRDTATDLALLKIDAGTQLPSISLGDSDRIRKGDWAIAIGHPFQFENTLTVGVISAKGRSLFLSEATRSFENFIQTDAAINFGNSGGPLMNINGEVIGINTAIRASAQGLGFATPINTAKVLLPQLKKGKVVRGYLGMGIKDVDDEVREAFDLKESRGALVQEVTPDKPAEHAGVKKGDIVVDVDGRPIRNNRDLIDYISYLPIGTTVKLGIIRGGQRMTINAKTEERPPDGEPEEETTPEVVEPVRNKLGMSVQNLSAETRRQYGMSETLAGVVVTSVKNVSAAGEANFNEGDVISEVQGQPVTNVEQFRAAVDKLRSGQRVRMYVTTPARGDRSVSGYRFLRVP